MFKRWRILAIFLLLIGLANFIRASRAFILTSALESYALSVSLPALGGFYALWGAIFLIFAGLSWFHRALRWAVPVAVAYQATLWTLRIFALRSNYARNLWARDLALTGVFLIIVVALTIKTKRNTSFVKRDT